MESIQPSRRAFLAAREIPGLLWGALRGEPAALRRILGARRSGRIGLLLAGTALALTAPGALHLAYLVALHVLLAFWMVIPRRGALPLRATQELGLSLWAVAPLLLVAACLRGVWPGSILPSVAAIFTGHVLVWRGARSAFGQLEAGAAGVDSR